MNCLVPRDPDIRIVAQNRNEINRSTNWITRRLTAVQIFCISSSMVVGRQVLLGSSVRFASIFRLGIRHIAEGTDHLLFLLALLLPAPRLFVRWFAWAGFAGVRHSVLQISKSGNSVYQSGIRSHLPLAALGLVHVPSRPIEVLIAFSIFVSAAHALRPLFPGREAESRLSSV